MGYPRPPFASHLADRGGEPHALRGKLRTTLDGVEREMIVEALKSARGNMAEAARKLGISERMIGLRVERFRVDLEKLRRSS